MKFLLADNSQFKKAAGDRCASLLVKLTVLLGKCSKWIKTAIARGGYISSYFNSSTEVTKWEKASSEEQINTDTFTAGVCLLVMYNLYCLMTLATDDPGICFCSQANLSRGG